MSWIGRWAAGSVAAVVATAVLVITPAAALAADERTTYYRVPAASSRQPETLVKIATRFLGDGSRSAEIFNLNVGRKQPDGGTLTDPNNLHKGWYIELPWDASGAGVKVGVMPLAAPATKPKAKPADKPAPTPSPEPSPSAASGSSSSVPSTGSRPSPAPVRPSSAGCATAARGAAAGTKPDWARLRLSPEKAWQRSRGKTQLVAVVDSGVNGALPQLAGHVTVGMDVVGPGGRGDTDCFGTGTAMAALIIAQEVKKGASPIGAAPDATVLPIRVFGKRPVVGPDIQVKAIESAVTAGATVIALGSYIDTGDTAVAKAISAAIARNVVVAMPAPLAAEPVNPHEAQGEGTLRVAGIGPDRQWAAGYRKGAVDVTAPGVNVTSLGATAVTSGSGTHYAVAYTAAVVALVRAAYPDLDAKKTANRVKVTAESLADGALPNGQFGYGMISPEEAVTQEIDGESQTAQQPSADQNAKTGEDAAYVGEPERSSGGRAVLLIVVALLMIGAALLLVNRIRKMIRSGGEDPVVIEQDDPELDLYNARYAVPQVPVAAGVGDGGPERRDNPDGHWADAYGRDDRPDARI